MLSRAVALIIMNFFNNILRILDTKMETPPPFGWFHLLLFSIAIIAGIMLCVTHKKGDDERVKRVVFIVALIVVSLEIYKQINFSFSYGDKITFDYQWYAFPWQFCSTPMYVGLLAGIFRKGRIHNALCAFLATYAMFAGLGVMFYPVQALVDIVGINIQTMICHGSMITVGIYLLYSQHVKLSHKSILPAMCVFGCALIIAVILNEIVYYTGIAAGETFNMFFVSRHHAPSLPVYSLVQAAVPYPWCLIFYFVGFSAAAYVILLVAMAIKAICTHIRAKKTEMLCHS